MNGISQLLLAVIFIIFGSFVEKVKKKSTSSKNILQFHTSRALRLNLCLKKLIMSELRTTLIHRAWRSKESEKIEKCSESLLWKCRSTIRFKLKFQSPWKRAPGGTCCLTRSKNRLAIFSRTTNIFTLIWCNFPIFQIRCHARYLPYGLKIIEVFISIKFFKFQTAFEVNGWEPKLDNVPPMLLKNGDYKVVFNYFAGPKEIYTLVGFGSIINIYF